MKSTIQTLRNDVETKNQKLEQMSNELKHELQTNSNHQQQISTVKAELQQKISELTAEKQTTTSHENRLRTLNMKLLTITQQLEATTADLQLECQQHDKTSQDLVKEQSAAKWIEQQLQQSQQLATDRMSQINQLKAELKSCREQFELQLQLKQTELNKANSAAANSSYKLNVEHSNCAEEHNQFINIKQQLTQLTSQHNQLQRKVKDQKALENQLIQLQENHTSVQSTLSSAKLTAENYNAIQTQLNESRQQNQTLQNQNQSLQSQQTIQARQITELQHSSTQYRESFSIADKARQEAQILLDMTRKELNSKPSWNVEKQSMINQNKQAQLQIKSVEKKLEELQRSTNCQVCFQSRATMAQYPCLHQCLCFPCYFLLSRSKGSPSQIDSTVFINFPCPICRTKVKAAEKMCIN